MPLVMLQCQQKIVIIGGFSFSSDSCILQSSRHVAYLAAAMNRFLVDFVDLQVVLKVSAV